MPWHTTNANSPQNSAENNEYWWKGLCGKSYIPDDCVKHQVITVGDGRIFPLPELKKKKTKHDRFHYDESV